MFLFFGKKKTKEPFIVLMTFSKETLAEIAKNYLKEEQVLAKHIKMDKFNYNVKDFMYMNFINDDNKIFKVLFQVNIKDNQKEREKLSSFVEKVFMCNDAEIENKKDFNFDKLNLKHGLVKNDILIISKDNKQELKPRKPENLPTIEDSYNRLSGGSIETVAKNNIINNYDFNNVVAKKIDDENLNDESINKKSFLTQGLFGNSSSQKDHFNFFDDNQKLFKNNDEDNANIIRNLSREKELE